MTSKVDSTTPQTLKQRASAAITRSGISIATAVVLTQLFFSIFNKGSAATVLTIIIAVPLYIIGVVSLFTSVVLGLKILLHKITKKS